MANGDVPDGSMAHGDGSGSEGDEAAWLDLIARYDAPAPAEGTGAPWPEREDLAGPVHVTPPDTLPDTTSGPDGPAPDVTALPPARLPGPPSPGGTARGSTGPGSGPRDAPIPELPEDQHYIPPPAPPLPKLEPVTKGAWLALFGGPLYLIIATAAGWTVSGLAAFLAVAAFIGGFAVLVLRMDSGPPKDRGPDDGAVV
ncbi:MAG TPA: hypothetical protein VHZ03_52495 [Trebonia sp.]|nr:hypothetical protein [Trebonia sp.]